MSNCTQKCHQRRYRHHRRRESLSIANCAVPHLRFGQEKLEDCFKCLLCRFPCFSDLQLLYGRIIKVKPVGHLLQRKPQFKAVSFQSDINRGIRRCRARIVAQKPDNSWKIPKLRVRCSPLPVQDRERVNLDNFRHVPLPKPPVQPYLPDMVSNGIQRLRIERGGWFFGFKGDMAKWQ